MKRVVVAMGQQPVARDPYAGAMWGKFKCSAFVDKRRRKPKHKGLEDW